MDAAPSPLLAAIAEKERELDSLRRQLAAFRSPGRIPASRLDVLRCRLGSYTAALLQNTIEEVLMMPALVVLPESPAWFMGLLQLGAESLPVVDLLARESGQRRMPDPAEFVVLVRTDSGRFGLVVDEIYGLSSLDAESLQSPTPDYPFAAHVLGVASIQGEQTLLLCADPLGSDVSRVKARV